MRAPGPRSGSVATFATDRFTGLERADVVALLLANGWGRRPAIIAVVPITVTIMMMTLRGWRWNVQSLAIGANVAMRAVTVDGYVAVTAIGKCRSVQEGQNGDAECQSRKEFFHRASSDL
jgi:hypothetical protein